MPEKPLEELESMVGTSRVTVADLAVEAGKVAEFAAALGEADPVYRDDGTAAERGHDRVPAPPTFTQVGRFPHYQPDDLPDGIQGFDLGFDPERTVHGEQEYEFERPVAVGDTLTGTTTLSDVSQREGDGGTLTFATLTTEYRTEADELVVTERRTAIETPPQG
jgi:acyl dehydratase